MRFRDEFVSSADRFSMGRDEEGGYYLSIPVSNQLVDYEEYYEISGADFDRFKRDRNAALSFITLCRDRKADHLLKFSPGRNRGSA